MTTDTNSQARTGNDIYERVTNQIIAAIEVGAGEYRMPWHHDGSAITTPVNAFCAIQTAQLQPIATTCNPSRDPF